METSVAGVNTGAYNRISNKPYSLLNQILLGRDGEWATFKQWTDLGGHIRKGEKSSFVVFWKIQPYEDINADGEKGCKTDTVTEILQRISYFTG